MSRSGLRVQPNVAGVNVPLGESKMEEVTWEQAADNGDIELILDGSRGIHLPEAIVEFNFANQEAMQESLSILESGPDNIYYWEAWQEVLDSGILLSDDGSRWTLYQDDSCFAIRVGVEIDWEE